MDDAQSALDRTQQRQLARFERMGLSARPMPDGLSLLVSLPLERQPLESITGPMLPRRVLFSTVGANLIKCLIPRAFFGLPPIDIRRCADAASIESAIRQAWRERTRELRETRSSLCDLGLEVDAIAENSALAFPLLGESPDARVMMQRLGEAILPGLGPLSGLPLEEPGDRVLEVSDCLASGSDLESRLGQRIHDLASGQRKDRKNGPVRAHLEPPPKKRPAATSIRPKILVVGPQLTADSTLLDALAQEGFRVSRSQNESEALTRLGSMSPDLVISQYGLGRSDGASLVQAMCGLPGIERIPVVLFDDICHESRRQVARTVGAAGYLTEPIQVDRIVKRLGRLVREPGDRRFTRYPQRLAARLEGTSQTCLITELGRGGVFAATQQIVEANTAMRFRIALPEAGKEFLFEGEVRYCEASQGASRQGIGLRFFDISSSDEATLIEYLARLEAKP